MTLLDVLGELAKDEDRHGVGVYFLSISFWLLKKVTIRRHTQPPNGVRG
jgi:hypothetical protein